MRLFEFTDGKEQRIKQLNAFVQWICRQIDCDPVDIDYGFDLDKVKELRTFGSTNSNGDIWVYVGDRNMADTMRTLAHELIHLKQFGVGTASDDMEEEQRQHIEDEANAIAGRLMREYGKQHEEIYESKQTSIIKHSR
jgi:Zn-dependent peptidase ImmA (M78 family)